MKKATILITLSIILSAISLRAQTKKDSTNHWGERWVTGVSLTAMGHSLGVYNNSFPPNSVMFSGKSGYLLKIDMVKNAKVVSIYNKSGYDSLIVAFDKKRMVWKNDSTFILINK